MERRIRRIALAVVLGVLCRMTAAQGGVVTTKTKLPAEWGSGAVVALNGKIYLLGGLSAGQVLDTVHEYDIAANTWRKRTKMTSPRNLHAACAFSGNIYVFGGSSPAALGMMSTVEAYDPHTDRWSAEPELPMSRFGLRAVSDGGRLYLIGGQTWDGQIRYFGTIDEYEVGRAVRPQGKLPTRWGELKRP